MEIQTVLSELVNYSSKTHSNYKDIVTLANDVLVRAEKIQVNLEDEKNKINKQIVKLDELGQDISLKLERIQEDLVEAQANLDWYSNACDSLSSDDSYELRMSLREGLRTAHSIVSKLEDREDEAKNVRSKVVNLKEHLCMILNATNRIIEASNNNIYQLKKHLSMLGSEADYNMKALKGMLDSVENYLRRKEFVSLMNYYHSDTDFYAGTSFSTTSTHNGKKTSKGIQAEISSSYKIKKQDLQKVKSRKGQVLLFQRYHPYTVEIKQMLLNTMICMGGDFQLFMLRCLDSVVFVRSKNAFIYETNKNRGRTLYIIGLDISNNYFPVLVYMHICHGIMRGQYMNEKMRMDQLLTNELNNKIIKTNGNLNKIYEFFKFKNLTTHKNTRCLTNVNYDLSTKFFGMGLKAYIEKDQNTLNLLKTAFPESYSVFDELLDRNLKRS